MSYRMTFPLELLRDVAEALELAVAYPDDYLSIIRSTHSPELLQAAAQLLPAATRTELRKLVLNANRMEPLASSMSGNRRP